MGMGKTSVLFVSLSTFVVIGVKAQKADQLDFAPRLSPDQSRVVYYSYRNDSLPDLYLMDLKTQKEIQLTSDYKAWDLNPKWAPNGEHIYFSSDRDGDMSIYRMALETMEIQRVTFPCKGYRHSEISFTSDGKTMAYCEFRPNRKTAIYLRELDNNRDTLLIRSAQSGDEFFKPVIHPDGNELVFLKNTSNDTIPIFDIFSLDIFTASVKNITRTPSVNERMPSWSSDGKYLMYSANMDSSSYDLFRRERDSRKMVQVSFFKDKQELNSHLTHTLLLFDSGYYGMAQEGNTYIYRADIDGRNVRQLTK